MLPMVCYCALAPGAPGEQAPCEHQASCCLPHCERDAHTPGNFLPIALLASSCCVACRGDTLVLWFMGNTIHVRQEGRKRGRQNKGAGKHSIPAPALVGSTTPQIQTNLIASWLPAHLHHIASDHSHTQRGGAWLWHLYHKKGGANTVSPREPPGREYMVLNLA